MKLVLLLFALYLNVLNGLQNKRLLPFRQMSIGRKPVGFSSIKKYSKIDVGDTTQGLATKKSRTYLRLSANFNSPKCSIRSRETKEVVAQFYAKSTDPMLWLWLSLGAFWAIFCWACIRTMI